MCVAAHDAARREGKDRWNAAGAYIIDEMLVQDNVGVMPEDAKYDPSLTARASHLTENVYKLIESEDEDDSSGGSSSDGLDEVMDANPKDAHEQEQQWKLSAMQAAQAAQMAGKLTANQSRFIDALVKSKVPWQELLIRFVSKRTKTDRSFSRPNRRFLSQGMYLPALSGETLGEIAIAVDCSGSIGIKELTEFASEIDAIKRLLRPAKINVFYFDSEVSHVESYTPDDELDIMPHGGGGTAFSPVIRAINNMSVLPECCIFLTDLYCADFGAPPEYPVLWVSNGASDAPWGEVAMMEGRP